MADLPDGRQRNTNASFLCAAAFQRVAEPFLPRIARRDEGGMQSPPTSLGDLVVAAANLAFALEPYIKTLLPNYRSTCPGDTISESYTAKFLRLSGMRSRNHTQAGRKIGMADLRP